MHAADPARGDDSLLGVGEELRPVLFSVTEGEDKPRKYPAIFNTSDAAIITKTDLADAVGFDAASARRAIESVRPGIEIFELSARSGAGMDALRDFLLARRDAARLGPPLSV